MKQTITVLAILVLALGNSYAGCGKTVTDKGKIKSYDKETKTVVIDLGGKEVTRTLTPSSKGADDIEKLVGKKATVVSSHDKIESVKKG